MKAYWRTCGYRLGNFGDELVPHILRYAIGIPDVGDAPSFESADLVSIGSILSEIPHDFHGYVWGTGAMFHHAPIDVPRARVRAVRGLLSAHRLGYSVPALGDPGLLVHRIPGLGRVDPLWPLSILPHYIDFNDEGLSRFLRRNPDVHVIDPCSHPLAVLREIRASGAVLSSSLHGLVCSDALGIPNRWVWLSDKLAGGDFKFRDYYSAFRIVDPIPVMLPEGASVSGLIQSTQKPNAEMLAEIQRRLIDAFPDELRRKDVADPLDEVEFDEPPVMPPGGFHA